MTQILNFLKKNWLTFCLLIAFIGMAHWIVTNLRPMGSMTPIEAQAMDMTAMKSPPGVHPVATEEVKLREVGASQTYPATVQALEDENVIARIPGRVVSLPFYPGDKVRSGQVVVKIEADEYGFKQSEANWMARARASMVDARRREVSVLEASLRKTRSELAAMVSNVEKAEFEFESAKLDAEKARNNIVLKERDAEAKQADYEYAEKQLQREARLHKAGASSQQEYEQALAARDSSLAMLNAARAEIEMAKREADSVSRRADAYRSAVSEAKAKLRTTRNMVEENKRMIEKAKSEVNVQLDDMQAAKSYASETSIVSGYRMVKALTNSVVVERNVSLGTVVMPGDSLLRLRDISRVRVQAQLPQRLASVIEKGGPVKIISGSVIFDANITSVFPKIDSETRTLIAEAVVDNSDGTLMPGQFVQMRIHYGHSDQTLAVRSSAIRTNSEGMHYVWLVKKREKQPNEKIEWTCTMHPEISEVEKGICPKCKMDLTPKTVLGDWIVKRRAVTIGPSDGTYTSVLQGLSPGDRVVYAGFEDLTEDSPVESVPWGEDGPRALPKGANQVPSEHRH